ncbi:transglycosylase SLT domain-containing protein [Flavobacterium cheniae]|uniref:Transglycosylase-like protein with SLT domain n=1 Tax=Flavobacterium cheniae TaxID=295428 RepID=A0A562KC88_9FLAO|nr:transglycosylase SLT domain-containing protein [Flavobacterium cheniae]TDR18584.1 transglycosylase-like protein with SLT domain [Flavobacterium cheniae]TWH92934.1 transglycosylase-like protein with SLT domain [Flavobacterium cheniae]
MKKVLTKKVAIVALIAALGSFFIYGVVSDGTKYSPVGYNLKMDFAGEEVPTFMADVQERLDKEMITNMNYHTNTTLVIKRANKVFPIIEPILKKYGVPDDFKYLAVIESSLVNAVSPAGARGVWQFMPATAKEKGMEVSDEVDERYHLEKSTEAACKYLLVAKEKFGSWTLAAASYNGGMNGISKKMEEQQVADYYDLLLTEETSRYVFRILALKEIMSKSEKYGFNIPNEALYYNIPTKKIVIDSSITDLAKFAKTQGVNYKILKIHNPWLRDKKLTITTGKKYEIEIPTSGYNKQ